MNQHSGGKLGVDRSAYYASAATWEKDVHGALRRERTIAWAVAAVFAVVAALEALALIALTPLKTVVPYAFVVDRQTGYVETARPLQAGPLSENAAVTQSNLAQYVLARETFDFADLQRNYQQTMLWSAGKAKDDYARLMRASNPQSPTRVKSRGAQEAVTVKSISLIRPGVALVRFDVDASDVGRPVERRAYAAIVGFTYTKAAMRMGERFSNPLGFQVLTYRRDVESLPVGTAPVESPAP